MRRKVIVIGGYLASEKSTFAQRLSRELHVPCLMKDAFKMAICQHVTIANRQDSSLFSIVTFDAMTHVLACVFEAGYPFIVESNFVPAGVKEVDEAGVLKRLIEAYRYEPLTFKFTGDTRVLHQRFLARERTAERGDANKIGAEVPYDTFDRWCHNLDAFNVGGRIVQVDASDFASVDFPSCIEMARTFMDAQ